MASRKKVVDAIKSLVDAKSLLLECTRVLHGALLIPVLLYDIGTMIWREKEESKIRAVHLDKVRVLLSIRRVDKVPNEWIREMYGVRRGRGMDK